MAHRLALSSRGQLVTHTRGDQDTLPDGVVVSDALAAMRADKAEGFRGEGLPAISSGNAKKPKKPKKPKPRNQRQLGKDNSSGADPGKTSLEIAQPRKSEIYALLFQKLHLHILFLHLHTYN